MNATTEKGRLLDWAVGTGRMAEKDRGAWASRYDRDPVMTTQQIGRIAAGAAAASSTARTAAVASAVLEGEPSGLPTVPAGRDSITLSARDYALVHKLAEKGLAVATRQIREDILGEAVGAGRIAAASVGEWRAKYNADPTVTHRALKALPALVHKPAAATAPSAPVSPPAATTAPAAPQSALDRWKAGEINLAKGQPASLERGRS